MKKITPGLVFDTLLSAVTAFILSFVLLNYFIGRPYSLIIAVCVALLFALLAFRLLYAKVGKKNDKDGRARECKAVLNQLCFDTKARVLSRFERAIKKSGLKSERKKGGLYVPERNLLIIPVFSFDGVNKTDIVKAFNAINSKEKAVIMSSGFSVETEAFAERFDGRIILMGGKKVFELLEKTDELPEIKCGFLSAEPKKASLKALFTKKRARSFFAFGILFLLMSFFSPIKLYYVICGCAMLIFAVLSVLFGKPEKTPD